MVCTVCTVVGIACTVCRVGVVSTRETLCANADDSCDTTQSDDEKKGISEKIKSLLKSATPTPAPGMPRPPSPFSKEYAQMKMAYCASNPAGLQSCRKRTSRPARQRGSAAQAADGPRLAGAPGRPRPGLSLREASRELRVGQLA